jgi:hypothetical protein
LKLDPDLTANRPKMYSIKLGREKIKLLFLSQAVAGAGGVDFLLVKWQ